MQYPVTELKDVGGQAMLTIFTIILAAVVMGVLAVVVGHVLGWADLVFQVEVDPKVEAILRALPGANCGGCGFVGCADYADAVSKGKVEVNLCGPGGTASAQRIAEIMGVETPDAFPYRAVVHCVASGEQRLQRVPYLGEPTCAGANLVAGVQGCVYGCLGLGDCVRACQYDAIHIVNGLAVVGYDKCTGCTACVRACTRNIITMVPFKSDRMLVVGCSNQDSGPDVKAVCKVGCVGGKVCTRNNDLMDMQGNLPRINYDKYDPQTDFALIIEKCPAGSLVFAGRSAEEDVAAVPHEDMLFGDPTFELAAAASEIADEQ